MRDGVYSPPCKLRLLLWEDCPRSCGGCCNAQWDLRQLPVATDFSGYDEILLTGGEPMLYPARLLEAVAQIRRTSGAARIYIYTALVRDAGAALEALVAADGMTVTLHEQADADQFRTFARCASWLDGKSLRVNVFAGVVCDIPRGWIAKTHIEWLADCPLPAGEVFMRLGASHA